jgi:hypothetical protein
MKNKRILSTLLLLIAAFLLAACDANESDTPQDSGVDEQGNPINGDQNDNSGSAGGGGFSGRGIEDWLQRINNDQLPLRNDGDALEWGLGYFLYYLDIDSGALDNLVYNALVVHRQIDTGEISRDSLTQNQQNLLDLTEGLQFDPNVDPTEQITQTPEIREAIRARVVQSQQDLSPEEALDSNQVIGVIATRSIEDIGGKYLVYTQDTPDAEFEFLGVVIVIDASGQVGETAETYSFLGWDSLPLLGDAAGPFWNNLPAGVSGDPANRNQGRPGVLLINESTYDDIE